MVTVHARCMPVSSSISLLRLHVPSPPPLPFSLSHDPPCSPPARGWRASPLQARALCALYQAILAEADPRITDAASAALPPALAQMAWRGTAATAALAQAATLYVAGGAVPAVELAAARALGGYCADGEYQDDAGRPGGSKPASGRVCAHDGRWTELRD